MIRSIMMEFQIPGPSQISKLYDLMFKFNKSLPYPEVGNSSSDCDRCLGELVTTLSTLSQVQLYRVPVYPAGTSSTRRPGVAAEDQDLSSLSRTRHARITGLAAGKHIRCYYAA
eukprot:1334061-Rhodomonas_salina.2